MADALAPWIVLSREAPPRIDATRWREQARTFLSAVVEAGDAARVLLDDETLSVQVARLQTPELISRVRVRAMPIANAPDARRHADEAVRAIGGAGFDALVANARTVWFVEMESGDARAPLVVAAALSLSLLAPIVPPEGGAIFAVKSARQRLEASGWTSGR